MSNLLHILQSFSTKNPKQQHQDNRKASKKFINPFTKAQKKEEKKKN